MTKVCIVGASGRMGTLLREVIARSDELSISGAIVAPEDIGRCATVGDIPYTSDIKTGIEGADLVLDFSSPGITLGVVAAASERGIPALVGTTGHTEAQRVALDAFRPNAPLLFAPNTSIGVFALTELVRSARSILGPGFDVEVLELHHRLKRDAPSGTAKLLAEVLGGAGTDRAHGGERADGSIGMASLRGGDAPGEHTVFFIGNGERLEITHRVRDRTVFAEGALRLGRALLDARAGRYSVGDVLQGISPAR